MGHMHYGTRQTLSISASALKRIMAEQVHFVTERCYSCLEKAKRLSLMEEQKKRNRENVEYLLSSLEQARREQVGFHAGADDGKLWKELAYR